MISRSDFRYRCKLATDCLPQAEYRCRLEALHAELLTEIERLRGERDASVAAERDRRAESAEDLYARLDFLSKALEASGRIDEHEHPHAYATILDAINFVRAA